ncbi:hypothetical protein MNEG_16053, partial [Monoraphidium neglectum]
AAARPSPCAAPASAIVGRRAQRQDRSPPRDAGGPSSPAAARGGGVPLYGAARRRRAGPGRRPWACPPSPLYLVTSAESRLLRGGSTFSADMYEK